MVLLLQSKVNEDVGAKFKGKILGGWRHNLWNNYPRHEFEYIRELPVFDKEFVSTYKDPVLEARKINTRDPVTQLFRAKSTNDK